MSRQYFPMPAPMQDLPFSDVILAGDTAYLSGHIGFEPGTTRVPAKLEDEVRLLMEGIRDKLARAGMTMDDLVSVTIFCPDLALFERFNAVYRTYFTPGRLPARAFIGSGPLLFGGHFEITAIAVRQK